MMEKAKVLILAVAAWIGTAPLIAGAQVDAAAKNAEQARTALNAMVQALGGDAWLNAKNRLLVGQIAAFFQGRPSPGTTKAYEFHEWPDRDRIDLTSHRDVVEYFLGRQGWEVTYQGKKPMQADILSEYLRRRDHSIEVAVKVWMKDPNTILVYEGQRMAERHLAEQVTLISPQNESITILMDIQSHLPLQRSYQYRDPEYHDKNTDTEEYAGYRAVDGIQTPFTITRMKNEDMQRQFFVTEVKYNQDLGADFWDPNLSAKKIVK
jgi:hypothetical protein